MIKNVLLNVFLLLAILSSCQGQSNKKEMKNDSIATNPLLCDIETGTCEMPGAKNENKNITAQNKVGKPVRVIYFTDPICSSCWGIEPQLRKLKLEYGDNLDIEYRMGGLLPDWSYNSGGISKPSDVAHHWDEVSIYYDMPIDGDVWLEDPLSSSYPPSIAFKAAELQDKEKAILFLRELRELVFLQKKNISKWEHIQTAAKNVGLDVVKLKSDFEGRAKVLFEEDLKMARDYGVRGFPSIFFEDNSKSRELIYGTKPYAFYEMAILKIAPNTIKKEFSKDWHFLFEKYKTLTAKEYAELSGFPRKESEDKLNDLTSKGILKKSSTKNGAIWKIAKEK